MALSAGNTASFKFNFFDDVDAQQEETVQSDARRMESENRMKPAFYIDMKEAYLFEEFPCCPLGIADLKYIHYAGELGGATDIIPGQFEGGHKIWQGSMDLIEFMEEQNVRLPRSSIVVELGCGHGLPGVLMLKKGATVYFQDLNEDSLSKATVPTIVINCGVDAVSRCKLVCGEWSQVAECIQEPKVNMILASDTIYTPATIRSFVSVVDQIADSDTIVWIASQKYYFGLGGGTQALIDIIKEMHLPLEVEIMKTVGEETVKRDIICIHKVCK